MSIILNHVNYIYNPGTVYEKKALDDINLTIEDGEYIGLAGHTGSGKSTLAQLFNGLLKVSGSDKPHKKSEGRHKKSVDTQELMTSSGGIYYDGRDINESDYPIKELRGNVGLVFQYPEHQLFEEDVFTDVCFGPKNLGLPEKEVQLRAYEALKAVGIKDESFYISPFDLSGGEKRKVAIAGVLAMKPKVLILDEPTAGLDPKGREEILTLIDELHEKNKMTVILISHSMDDLAEHAKRLIVMNDGRIAFDGPIREVFKYAAELEKIGLSVPVATQVVTMLRERGIPVRGDAITVEEAKDLILQALGR